MLRRTFALLLLAALAPVYGQRTLSGEIEIRQALEKLNTLGSVMMIAAHPDDENTALLAYLARGRHVRTAYLALTRGEGGQNLIGSEQGDQMGIIRTQELLAARKIDGAEMLRRVRDEGVSVMCAAPAVVASVLAAAQDWEGEIPGRGRVRIVVAGAPPPTTTVARVETELGWELIQIYGLTETSPLLTVNRTRAEWDDLDPQERAARLVRAGAPALGVELDVSPEGEVLARANQVMEGYWEQPQESAEIGRAHA